MTRHCPRCNNRGLIRISYRSGEAFDVAICDCQAGQLWRAKGDAAVRDVLQLQPDQQVTDWEDAELDEAELPVPTSESFIEAGNIAPRAKL